MSREAHKRENTPENVPATNFSIVPVASNLTPDPTTGIGKRYNEASFVATMRTGKKPNGTAVMPPMPAEVYQNMTDDDLKAIWAYLQTVKPINNPVFAGLTPPAK